MTQNFLAYIERDVESGAFIGVVPSLGNATTCANNLEELHEMLKELISLELEIMNDEDKKLLPEFHGLATIEVAV